MLVGPDGVRVERILVQRLLDRSPREMLRVRRGSYLVADCASVADVADLIDWRRWRGAALVGRGHTGPMASGDFVACECGALAKLEDQGVPLDQRTRCPDCGGLAHEIAVAVHQVIEAKMTASAEVIPKPEEPRH